ncbi:MAG: porin family protein [Prevotellaceae bacterium]|nr:porin family protein [Prevotellaceae bacterium]
MKKKLLTTVFFDEFGTLFVERERERERERESLLSANYRGTEILSQISAGIRCMSCGEILCALQLYSSAYYFYRREAKRPSIPDCNRVKSDAKTGKILYNKNFNINKFKFKFMRKFISLISLVLLCGAASMANAQEFKPFRVDAGIGYGLPFTKGFDGGIAFYAEPKYAIADKIAVGLRWEGALFAGESEDLNLSISSGYYATGDYYFNNNKFRPFAGLGLGMYSVGSAKVKVNTEDVVQGVVTGDAQSSFGMLVRAGFDFSHIRFALSYNLATTNPSFSYLGISLGFYIGGGKN